MLIEKKAEQTGEEEKGWGERKQRKERTGQERQSKKSGDERKRKRKRKDKKNEKAEHSNRMNPKTHHQDEEEKQNGERESIKRRWTRANKEMIHLGERTKSKQKHDLPPV